MYESKFVFKTEFTYKFVKNEIYKSVQNLIEPNQRHTAATENIDLDIRTKKYKKMKSWWLGLRNNVAFLERNLVRYDLKTVKTLREVERHLEMAQPTKKKNFKLGQMSVDQKCGDLYKHFPPHQSNLIKSFLNYLMELQLIKR